MDPGGQPGTPDHRFGRVSCRTCDVSADQRLAVALCCQCADAKLLREGKLALALEKGDAVIVELDD